MGFAIGVAVGIAIGWLVFEKPEAMRNATDTVKGWVKKEGG